MELTLDNVYKLLDSTEYTANYLRSTKIDEPHFSSQDWTDTIKLLLDSLWPGYRIKNFERNEGAIRGGICNLPLYLESKVFKDVTIVSILGLYPTLISKLSNLEKTHNALDPYDEEEWEDKSFFKEKLIWNVDNFPTLYDFLQNNKKEFNKFNNDKVSLLINTLLNYTWGVMNNKYSLFCCKNGNVVADTARRIMEHLHDTFQNHLIYQSYDCIFFSAYDEIKDKFETILKDMDIKFRADKHLYFIPFKKKKYILSDNEILNFAGFGQKISNLREHYENERINSSKGMGQDPFKELKKGESWISGLKQYEEESEEGGFDTNEYVFDPYNPNNKKEISNSLKIAAQTIGLDLVKDLDKYGIQYTEGEALPIIVDEKTFMPKLAERYGKNLPPPVVTSTGGSFGKLGKKIGNVVGVKLKDNVKPLPHNLDDDMDLSDLFDNL